MAEVSQGLTGRVLIVAFEGWNDAGEAATGAVKSLRDSLGVQLIAEIDAEGYFDYQFNRPVVTMGEDGKKKLVWPTVTMYEPATSPDAIDVEGRSNNGIYLLLGTEPARSWKSFTAEILGIIQECRIDVIVMLGAMLADVPHTRPISVFVSSENADVRAKFDIERSTYEGPVGILSVISAAAETAGIPTLSIWASVPHYVHNAPAPKATLAMIQKLEELVEVVVPRGDLVEESTAWEDGINALAEDDEDMATYIAQLERARDTVDSPEASGDAIAEEFERYLRKRDGKADGRDRS
ncbi:MAG: PAC2 family protein [Terrimesophilobacter sp.]